MIDCVLEVGNLSEWTHKLVHLILFVKRYQRSYNFYFPFDPIILLLGIYCEIIILNAEKVLCTKRYFTTLFRMKTCEQISYITNRGMID